MKVSQSFGITEEESREIGVFAISYVSIAVYVMYSRVLSATQLLLKKYIQCMCLKRLRTAFESFGLFCRLSATLHKSNESLKIQEGLRELDLARGYPPSHSHTDLSFLVTAPNILLCNVVLRHIQEGTVHGVWLSKLKEHNSAELFTL